MVRRPWAISLVSSRAAALVIEFEGSAAEQWIMVSSFASQSGLSLRFYELVVIPFTFLFNFSACNYYNGKEGNIVPKRKVRRS